MLNRARPSRWPSICRRSYSNDATNRKGWLWVDSIFPIQLGRWDLRKSIGSLREEHLLGTLRSRLENVSSHNFKVLSVEPRHKDGGAFVKFSYSTRSVGDNNEFLQRLEQDINEEFSMQGGVPAWNNISRGALWMVQGNPWKEDMDHYATPLLRVSFDGPDVPEQSLWEVLRRFGRIKSMSLQTPDPKSGILRSVVVNFSRLREATIARNVIHDFDALGSRSGQPQTRLKAMYDRPPLPSQSISKWLSSHPRIVLPVILFLDILVIVFLIGTVTYTIFDPLRTFLVQAKVGDWFSFKGYRIYGWDESHTTRSLIPTEANALWKDRKEAKQAIEKYLQDVPSTLAFVHGPQGSGKSNLLQPILDESQRNFIIIDCRPIINASTDAQALTTLAAQVGYWPMFGFMNSFGHLLDLASAGLIGQKPGFSASAEEQVQSILHVVGSALKKISASHREHVEAQARKEALALLQEQSMEDRRQKIRTGTWHDGRLDCVAGNGIISEVGIGDERFEEEEVASADHEKPPPPGQQHLAPSDPEMGLSLPIVVIKGFASTPRDNHNQLLDVIAQWSASLVENQVAHVLVLSDNRENSKRLTKNFPLKPLNSIPLFDADSASALVFVRQKLNMQPKDVFTAQETAYIERLGGRASDLESMIHKVRNGASVKDAVEDIIARAVAELLKDAFGNDWEDAQRGTWTREQAWRLLKLLSSNEELPYANILLEYPFKGDESALRSMESIELISVGSVNGRPSTIRPGKPVLRYAFQKLANDPIFQASQDISYNQKVIKMTEAAIKDYEAELLTLKELGAEGSWFDRGSAMTLRARRIQRKLYEAERKIQALEKHNSELRKILKRGG